MSIGVPVRQQDVDAAMADLALNVRAMMRKIQDLGDWAATINTDDLTVEPFSYSPDDAYLIKSTLDRLNSMRAWAAGEPQALEVGHNLMADLAKMTGVATSG
jgi:hypothetical protein